MSASTGFGLSSPGVGLGSPRTDDSHAAANRTDRNKTQPRIMPAFKRLHAGWHKAKERGWPGLLSRDPSLPDFAPVCIVLP